MLMLGREFSETESEMFLSRRFRVLFSLPEVGDIFTLLRLRVWVEFLYALLWLITDPDLLVNFPMEACLDLFLEGMVVEMGLIGYTFLFQLVGGELDLAEFVLLASSWTRKRVA